MKELQRGKKLPHKTAYATSQDSTNTVVLLYETKKELISRAWVVFTLPPA